MEAKGKAETAVRGSRWNSYLAGVNEILEWDGIVDRISQGCKFLLIARTTLVLSQARHWSSRYLGLFDDV